MALRKIKKKATGKYPIPKPPMKPSPPLKESNVVDKVEKVLLGLSPNDSIGKTGSIATGPDGRERQLAIIRSFLNEQPKLRAHLTQEIEEAWKSTGRKPAEFSTEMAERRAQILSQAELAHWQKQAPQAVANFRIELERYLAGIGS